MDSGQLFPNRRVPTTLPADQSLPPGKLMKMQQIKIISKFPKVKRLMTLERQDKSVCPSQSSTATIDLWDGQFGSKP